MQFDWLNFISQFSSSGITACLTVLTGVLVFVLGQFVIKFFIEPIQAQAQLLGEIAHSVTFYANVEGNSGLSDKEYVKEVSQTLRKQASQLRATAWTIRLYWLWQLLRIIPKKKNVIKASEQLIGWSNSLFRDSTNDRKEEIKKLLGFK